MTCSDNNNRGVNPIGKKREQGDKEISLEKCIQQERQRRGKAWQSCRTRDVLSTHVPKEAIEGVVNHVQKVVENWARRWDFETDPKGGEAVSGGKDINRSTEMDHPNRRTLEGRVPLDPGGSAAGPQGNRIYMKHTRVVTQSPHGSSCLQTSQDFSASRASTGAEIPPPRANPFGIDGRCLRAPPWSCLLRRMGCVRLGSDTTVEPLDAKNRVHRDWRGQSFRTRLVVWRERSIL